MKKIVMPFIGFIILVSTILLVNYKTSPVDLKIYASKDSYANKYANKHNLEYEEVSDSEKETYSIAIENFEYKKIDKGIELTKYLGISKYLVIPNKIDGNVVLSINKSLFENKNIETIILPSSITNIDDNSLKIECEKSDYCNSLVNDKKATMLDDSVPIDFTNHNNLVEYNLNNDKIEITKCLSKDNITIIPETINGYDVLKVNIDVNNVKAIYIPDSVNAIELKNVSTDYIYVIVGLILCYIFYLIMTLTNSDLDLNHVTKNTTLYIISIFYLLLISYFSCQYSNSYFIEVSMSSLIYLFLAILLKINKKQNIKYEEKIMNHDSFIQEALSILHQADKNDEYHLEELIKYSDPVSIKEVEKIENSIIEKLNSLNKANAEEMKQLIKERNRIIKNNK